MLTSFWMELAFKQAEKAQIMEEVPVGAVLVIDEQLISAAHNLCISNNDPTAHAEILALREACAKIGNYRLKKASLYTTLEPCAMCAGALVHARIDRLYFAARDPKAGAVGSCMDLLSEPFLNHRIKVTPDVAFKRSESLLKNFFKKRRKQSCEPSKKVPVAP